MATVDIYTLSGDGLIRNADTTSTWSALRNASTGTLAAPSGNPTGVYADNRSDLATRYIDRVFLPIDLSALAGATITAAVLSLNTVGAGVSSGAGGAVCLVSGSPASTSTLATSDFGSVGATEFMTRINFASIASSGRTTLALNAAGISYLQGKVGTTAVLALRSSFDLDDSAPGTGTYSNWSFYASEQSGTANDPYITITYTPAATPVTASDSGTGSEGTATIMVTSYPVASDSGTGSDGSSISTGTASKSASDTATGSDASSPVAVQVGSWIGDNTAAGPGPYLFGEVNPQTPWDYATGTDAGSVTALVGVVAKTATDNATGADASSVSVTYSLTATDSGVGSDFGGGSATPYVPTYRLPLTADFISARSQTADFVSARAQTADFIQAPA